MVAVFNPNNSRDLVRLRDAVEASRKRLKVFRENRMSALREYVGSHYSGDATRYRVPINLIELAVNIYRRHLVPSFPAALVTARLPELKRPASLLELALNRLLKQIDFYKSLCACVLDGLFSVGIMKTGLFVTSQWEEVEGVLHDVGQPFADPIDLDDWVHDITARTYERAAFAGNRYRLPLEFVKESPAFKNTADLNATYKSDDLTEPRDEKVEVLSRGAEATDADEFVQYIDLWDLWLPAERLYLTIPAYGDHKALRVIEWEGPERGPYHFLSYGDVPGQVMPLAPVALWRDMHDIANIVFNKLGRQAERQKSLLGYASGSVADADRVVNASDGEAVRMDNPEATKEFNFGGVNREGLAFLLSSIQQFSWLAGNLDALGGLSPMSETVGQDRMLVESASRRVEVLQDRTIGFIEEVMSDLAWYLWNDPLIELPLTKRIAGTSIDIQEMFSPEAREGDIFDYAITINPYSLRHNTPTAKLQMLDRLFQSYLAPFMGVMAEQGVTVDFQGLLRLIGRLTDMPELQDILTYQEPRPDVGEQATRMAVQKPSETTRRYIRENRPARSKRGVDFAMAQTLLGGGVQDAEAGAATGIR